MVFVDNGLDYQGSSFWSQNKLILRQLITPRSSTNTKLAPNRLRGHVPQQNLADNVMDQNKTFGQSSGRRTRRSAVAQDYLRDGDFTEGIHRVPTEALVGTAFAGAACFAAFTAPRCSQPPLPKSCLLGRPDLVAASLGAVTGNFYVLGSLKWVL